MPLEEGPVRRRLREWRERSSSPQITEEIERDPRTDKIVAIHGKVVRVILLPDWILEYVEFETKEEKEVLRKTLMRLEFEEELKIVKVTDKRIYFEAWRA